MIPSHGLVLKCGTQKIKWFIVTSGANPSALRLWGRLRASGSYFKVSRFQEMPLGEWKRLVPVMKKFARGASVKIMVSWQLCWRFPIVLVGPEILKKIAINHEITAT